MKDAMQGMNSPEREKHLAECSDCASDENMFQLLKEIPPRNPEVPAELDSVVLAYAVKKMPSNRKHTSRFMVKFVWLPIAAAMMICFGLVYALHPYTKTASSVRIETSGKSAMKYEMMDNLDSEIFLLSSQIQETSVSLRSATAYSTIYTQNRIN